jgi:hypothetical protein
MATQHDFLCAMLMQPYYLQRLFGFYASDAFGRALVGISRRQEA